MTSIPPSATLSHHRSPTWNDSDITLQYSFMFIQTLRGIGIAEVTPGSFITSNELSGGLMPLVNNVDLIKQYLDARIASQDVYASNVANAETPNFLAGIPTFKIALDRSHGVPIPKAQVQVEKSRETPRQDGNNVNLEHEMAAMAQNSMKYMTAVKLLTKEMAITRYAITSGGR